MRVRMCAYVYVPCGAQVVNVGPLLHWHHCRLLAVYDHLREVAYGVCMCMYEWMSEWVRGV